MFGINTQALLPIVGYSLIAIFVLVGGGIVFGIWREKQQNMTEEEKAAKKEAKTKKTKAAKQPKEPKAKKDSKGEKETSSSMFATKEKKKTTPAGGFSVSAGSSSVEDVVGRVSELNGARSINRFRPSARDEVSADETPAFRTFATAKAQEPAPAAPQEPVTPVSPSLAPAPTKPAAFTPSPIKGLPALPPTLANKPGVAAPPVVKKEADDPTKQIFVGKTQKPSAPPSFK